MGVDQLLSADAPSDWISGIVQAILSNLPALEHFIVDVSASKQAAGLVVLIIVLIVGGILAYNNGRIANWAFAFLALCMAFFVFVFISLDSVSRPVVRVDYKGHPKNISTGALKPEDLISGSFTRLNDKNWNEVVGIDSDHPGNNAFVLTSEDAESIFLLDASRGNCPTEVWISLPARTVSTRCHQQGQGSWDRLYVVTDVVRK